MSSCDMFRRNKENKAKLEHKLYLAREKPEPTFDLSDCNLSQVPRGIYSLCRVFLKRTLELQNNLLHSFSGGGNMSDLQFLKVLNISNNKFKALPADVCYLANLEELYASNNQIKFLPRNLCSLEKLSILDLSNNCLKELPENVSGLIRLRILKLKGNKDLHSLPKSICRAQRLELLDVDCDNFVYPPVAVAQRGTEDIIKYICDDTGYTYDPSNIPREYPYLLKSVEQAEDHVQVKIRTLQKEKEDRVNTFLDEIERNNELVQKQEFAIANISKANKEKLLADIISQQEKLNSELTKVQQERDEDRFRLIEQLQEAEQKADVAINTLLNMNNEPITQLLEQEKKEEDDMIAIAMNKYNEALAKNAVLADMQELLNQETEKFRLQYTDRTVVVQSMLEKEAEKDDHLLQMLSYHSCKKAEFVAQLQNDEELQKAAVGALLERGDARSWGLLQQVRFVEAQLAALTAIEIDKKKLELDQHLNDLAEKRSRLSMLLLDLIHQQNQRRTQLLSTLKTLDENKEAAVEDFWLRQYQGLLNRFPTRLSESQKNLDPSLCQDLLMAGVMHCLPFLAKITQCKSDLTKVTDYDLLKCGIQSPADRQKILKVFQHYQVINRPETKPSAPPLEEASAPPAELPHNEIVSECVVCMDSISHTVFVPCGHFCCCLTCSSSLTACPLCRASIAHKIRLVACRPLYFQLSSAENH